MASTKTQELIAAARERTRLLLEAQKNPKVSIADALPGNVSMLTPKTVLTPTQHVIAGNLSFDPFDIPGVGRANEQQSKAIRMFGLEGKSGCLIGPAGTGKTTTMRAIIRAIILSGRVPILSEGLGHKYLRGGLPGIFGGSFTRIATRNLKNNCPPDIQDNVHTVHRLLEFEPEVFDVADPIKGGTKKVRVFKPTRNAFRSLPRELLVFLLDETSMIGVRLHEQLIDAIHPAITPQILYIGDIAQIPPVMDDAILGYKMLEFLKVDQLVELTEVYRHAGAIVHLANHIRVGNTIPDNRSVLPYLGNLRKLPKKLVDEHIAKWSKEEDGSKVTIHLWKTRLEGDVGQIKALRNLGDYEPTKLGFFPKEIIEGRYNPLTDMILIPYNKAVGTTELNKYIAQFLQKQRVEAATPETMDTHKVHEVIAGFNKHYFAVGDKVFYEREEAIITKINVNAMYAGRATKVPSVTLDRWGHDRAGQGTQIPGDQTPIDDVEMLLNIDIGSIDDERKNQASHVLYLKKLADMGDDSVEPDDIKTAADINALIFGYALTIHKSQGSQWKKVYCVFHNSHNRNLQRELLYTAITRAQKELYVIAEPETFIQGVLSQHIIGNSLEEKAKFFITKAQENLKKKELFLSDLKAGKGKTKYKGETDGE